MAFTNKQSTFQSATDKANIFYQSWTKPKAKRVLILQHGFGEHSDRYGNILEKLKDDDFNIYALDARGHGKPEIEETQQVSQNRKVRNGTIFTTILSKKN